MNKFYLALLMVLFLVSFKLFITASKENTSSILRIQVKDLDNKLTIGERNVYLTFRDTVTYFD